MRKPNERRNAGSVQPAIPAVLEQLENRQLLSAATGPFQEPPQLAPSDFDPTTGETIKFEAAADGETTLLTILDASNADPAISIVSLSVSRLRSFIEISDDGRSVEYTPFVGAAGEDSFVYQRSDGSTHEVTIELVAPAENDSFTVFEASPATTLDVLANDTLPQGYTGPGKITSVFGVNVSLLGGQGNDIIIGSQGDDYIVGGDGDDILLGGAGSDFMLGGRGRDQMRGHSGRDHMRGGQGSDRIDGGRGRNELVREQFQPHSQNVLDPEVDTLIGDFDEITIPEIDVQALNDTLLDVLDSAGI